MLLIFFNTVMFLLTILALKKFISTLFTQRMWNHRSQVSHPKKSFATPSSSPQALHSQSSSSSCSTSSSSVDDSSGGIYSQFLFPPRVQIPPPLFLCPPLVLTPLLCFFCCSFSAFLCSRSFFLFLFGFIFLPFLLIFSSYILMCSSLVERRDLVTARGCFCFD